MVGKQAVRPNCNLLLVALLRQEVTVDPVVERAKEGRLPPVSPLGHVMRQSWNDEPRDSCHVYSKDAVSVPNLALAS